MADRSVTVSRERQDKNMVLAWTLGKEGAGVWETTREAEHIWGYGSWSREGRRIPAGRRREEAVAGDNLGNTNTSGTAAVHARRFLGRVSKALWVSSRCMH